MEHYSAITKKEILPFVTTRRDRQSLILSEIRQTEVDKYLMVLSLTCRISKEANSETE